MVLYLSRVAAKQTIGHLVHEVLQQIAQPDPPEADLAEAGSPYAAGTPDGGTPKASAGVNRCVLGCGVGRLQGRRLSPGAACLPAPMQQTCNLLIRNPLPAARSSAAADP